jgi:hypothetical protein
MDLMLVEVLVGVQKEKKLLKVTSPAEASRRAFLAGF